MDLKVTPLCQTLDLNQQPSIDGNLSYRAKPTDASTKTGCTPDFEAGD